MHSQDIAMYTTQPHKFKPCKGCWHFSPGIWGASCNRTASMRRDYDPTSDEHRSYWIGQRKAREERAPKGACGPQAKYYITLWGLINLTVRKLFSK